MKIKSNHQKSIQYFEQKNKHKQNDTLAAAQVKVYDLSHNKLTNDSAYAFSEVFV